MNFIKPKLRQVLSLDIGLKRIGLAYCDYLHITVNILPAVLRNKEYKEFISIGNYIKKHNISGFVFGLPLDDECNMTKQSFDCLNYGELIIKEFKLPYSFVNENSSTWESLDRFKIKKDKSGLIDSLSAKIILEQWIKEGPELKEITF